MPCCRANNARGEPCGSPEHLVDPETRLCPAHRPGGREKLRERARKGGEATRRRFQKIGLAVEDLPPLLSPQAAERWAEVVGRAVASGRLTHAQGKAISALLREWRASHEAGEVAETIAELREQVSALKERGGLRAAG